MNRIGLVISFAGVLMVILTKSKGISAEPKGILLMFVAVFSAVGYTMLAKKLGRDYNPITITAYQSFYGLIMFVPLFLIFELPVLDIEAASTQACWQYLPGGIWLGYMFYSPDHWNQGTWVHARANVFGNLIPVVTAILSFLLLKESMPLLKILGILVVITGFLCPR